MTWCAEGVLSAVRTVIVILTAPGCQMLISPHVCCTDQDALRAAFYLVCSCIAETLESCRCGCVEQKLARNTTEQKDAALCQRWQFPTDIPPRMFSIATMHPTHPLPTGPPTNYRVPGTFYYHPSGIPGAYQVLNNYFPSTQCILLFYSTLTLTWFPWHSLCSPPQASTSPPPRPTTASPYPCWFLISQGGRVRANVEGLVALFGAFLCESTAATSCSSACRFPTRAAQTAPKEVLFAASLRSPVPYLNAPWLVLKQRHFLSVS